MLNQSRVKVTTFLSLSLFLLAIIPSIARAEIPQKISYQGYLTDGSGAPINGFVNMIFGIYGVASGGRSFWSETHNNVPVSGGLYNVILGESNPIDLKFDTPYYLGIVVNSDPEMTPRKVLTSVGYAFRASEVDTLQTHQHSGADITSGTVADARIDAAIARDSELASAIGAHSANTSAHHTRYTDAEAVAAIKANDGPGSTLNADLLDGLDSTAFASSGHNHGTLYYTKAEVDALVSGLQSQIAALQDLLLHFSRSGNNIYITGANLNIRSGSGTTWGTVNGLGNLVVGYNEGRGSGDDKTGSHNLIVGPRHNYSSYGGGAVGYWNTISNTYSLAGGGSYNTVSGNAASVGGGYLNEASGNHASISGGRNNKASGDYSHVAGGGGNTVAEGNEAYSNYSVILGGQTNIAGSPSSGDRTIGENATIGGGYNNKASGNSSVVGGGYGNAASGQYSSVNAGYQNTASGTYSTTSGARPDYDSGWVSIQSCDAAHFLHNLGGDRNKYKVDVSFRRSDGITHHIGYGGGGGAGGGDGAYWHTLTENQVYVARNCDDLWVDQVRVRIWVNN
jgi:hypothetical protein